MNYFMNDMHNDHEKSALHIKYTLSNLDFYIMTLSELCLQAVYYLICVACDQRLLKTA
jgi:hypothetical protein